MKKRLLSFLLSAALIFSVVPMGMFSAFAEESTITADFTDTYSAESKIVLKEGVTVYGMRRKNTVESVGGNTADAQVLIDTVGKLSPETQDVSPAQSVAGTKFTSQGYKLNETTDKYETYNGNNNLASNIALGKVDSSYYYSGTELKRYLASDSTALEKDPYISKVGGSVSNIFYNKDTTANTITQYRYRNRTSYKLQRANSTDNTVTPTTTNQTDNLPYVYEELKYELDVDTNLTDIAVGFQFGQDGYKASSYGVFVGESYDNLTQVYDFAIEDHSTITDYQIIHFNTPVTARYVVVRVFDPLCAERFNVGKNPTAQYLYATRMSVFKVYGTLPDVSVISDHSTAKNDSGFQKPVREVNDIDFYSLPAKTGGVDSFHAVSYQANGLPTTTNVYSNFSNDATRKCLFTADGKQAEFQSIKWPSGNFTASKKYTSDDIAALEKTDGQFHLDMYYDFKAVCDIKEVVVTHHHDAYLRFGKYELYASNNLSDLYSPESLVETLDGKAVKDPKDTNYRTVIGGLSLQQNIIFNTQKQARYVGIRIWKPQAALPYRDNPYIRMYEFNVYGKKTDKVANETIEVGTNDKTITSLIPVATDADVAVEYKQWNNETSKFEVSNTVTDDGNIANYGNLHNNANTAQNFYITQPYFKDNGKQVVDISYDLKASKQFDSVYLKYPNSTLIGRYAVYASDSIETLYNKENIIAEYNGSAYGYGYYTNDNGGASAVCYQYYTLKTPVKAQYVALRIIDPRYTYSAGANLSAGLTVSIQEFNVYDTRISKTKQTLDTYKKGNTIETNLIRNKKLSLVNVKDGKESAGSFQKGENITTDNVAKIGTSMNTDLRGLGFMDADRNLIDDESKQYQQVNCELDGQATIKTIGLLQANQVYERASHVKLIFADKLEDLYETDSNPEKNVTVYEFRDNGNSQVLVITLNKEVKAKYIGIRFICGIQKEMIDVVSSKTGAPVYNSGNSHARLWHVSINGQYVEGTNQVLTAPDNTTQVLPNSDSIGNYPVGATATLTAKDVEGKTFVKWADATSGKYISNVTTYTYTLTDTAPVTVNPVFASATDGTKVIKLADAKTGEVIDVLYNSDMGELETALKNAAPKKFGYTVTGINGDLDSATSVSPTYARDTSEKYKYTITAKDVDSTSTDRIVAFDTRVIVTSESTAANIYWKNSGDSVIGVEKTIDFYACANDTVTAYEGEETAPAVTMLAATDTSNYGVFTEGKNSMTVFGKYDSDTAVKFGVAFTSKALYEAASGTPADEKWNNLFESGKAKVVEFAANGTTKGYFMGTLEGITTSSKATRYAVCFVVDAEGTRTYSATQNLEFN